MTSHAMNVRHYCCPTCGATKEIRQATCHPECARPFPERVPCGWRGCPDWAVETAYRELTDDEQAAEDLTWD